MNYHDSPDPELFEKFLSGECSPEEEERVLAFLKDNPQDERTSRVMEKAWEKVASTASGADDQDTRQRYRKLRSRIQVSDAGRTDTWRIYRIAASVSILFTCCIFAYVYRYSIQELIDPVKYISRETLQGQRLRIQLSDGSVVWLNASSTLIYPEKFRGERREVKLTGEAFFEVKRNEKIPFSIRTGPLFVKVLGTSFNVKAYDEENDMQVTVATGKVAVGLFDSMKQESTSLTVLSRNEKITYSVSTGFFVTEAGEASQATAWIEGRLVFRKETMETIAQVLERWYGVTVSLSNTAHDPCNFTSAFPAGASLQDVLETFRITGKITYEIKGRSVHIQQIKSCSEN